MVAVDILGLNLPLFIVVTLFFSVLIWSKFLKQNKLAPENINDVMDITSIFIFILLFQLSILLFTSIIFGILSYNLSWSRIWNETLNFSIPFLTMISIYAFISFYRRKRPTRKNLKPIFSVLIQSYLIIIIFYFSIYFMILITPLRIIFTDLIFLLPSIFVGFFLCYFIITNTILKVDSLNEIFSPSFLKLAIPAILISLSIFLFIPHFSYENENYGRYIVENTYNGMNTAYLEIELPIRTKSFGILGNIVPTIPIPYGAYHMGTESHAGKNFEILVNTTEYPYPKRWIESFETVRRYSKQSDFDYGFNRILLNEELKMITLKYDYSKIKKENINGFIIKGYIEQNLSGLDYSYLDNTNDWDVCTEEGCTIRFNISSKLPFPIKHNSDTLLNFNNKKVINKTGCRFVNVSSNYPKKGKIWQTDSHCSDNSCELYLRAQDESSSYPLFELDLSIVDNLLRLSAIRVEHSVDVSAEFDIDCT